MIHVEYSILRCHAIFHPQNSPNLTYKPGKTNGPYSLSHAPNLIKVQNHRDAPNFGAHHKNHHCKWFSGTTGADHPRASVSPGGRQCIKDSAGISRSGTHHTSLFAACHSPCFWWTSTNLSQHSPTGMSWQQHHGGHHHLVVTQMELRARTIHSFIPLSWLVV